MNTLNIKKVIYNLLMIILIFVPIVGPTIIALNTQGDWSSIWFPVIYILLTLTTFALSANQPVLFTNIENRLLKLSQEVNTHDPKAGMNFFLFWFLGIVTSSMTVAILVNLKKFNVI
jgi:hypothetical protein